MRTRQEAKYKRQLYTIKIQITLETKNRSKIEKLNKKLKKMFKGLRDDRQNQIRQQLRSDINIK